MDLEKATSYIDALYEKRGLSKKGYIEATELQEFGTVWMTTCRGCFLS